MTWVDLSSAFGFGAVLTSAQMQNLRDNLTAMANGDSGAPNIQTAGIASGAITASRMYNPGAGTLSMYGVPNDKTPLATISYTKACEIVVCFNGGVRVAFDLYNAGSGTVYGRVYVNGSPVGTAHSQSGAGSSSFYDDISISQGDLIQIYAYTTGSGSDAILQNIEIKTDSVISGHIAEVKI